MSNAEKELEERLVEIGNSLLAQPSDVDELLPLLDKAETFLSRVEQSPSESMSAALYPAMKGLIAKELLGHVDADVKVAVASCISEITRITAPEAPYDDDLMKEIFQMIVEAFEKLDDISSCSYSKRVSILETVAKVRSCVVMLDLECDALILEMFHNFLRTIRDNHPENVFSSMVVIMTLVLEESEDISPELLSSLLMRLKKNTVDILPVARRLAEKVISNCAFKLKPCLMEVVQSLGAPLSDYSKIVANVSQENSDVLEHNGLNASGECVADDSKFSEWTVSDELAQGSGKMESEVSCPEVGTVSGRSPKSVMSNGIVQTGNDGCLVEPTSPNRKTERSQRNMLSKNASAARTEAVKTDLLDVKDTSSDHSNKKSKGHRSNSAIQLSNMNDSSQIVDEKGDMEKLPDTSRPKRGRPSGSKGSTKKERLGDVAISPSGSDKAKVIENTDTAAPLSSKKQIKGTNDSDTKPSWHSGKKQSARSVDDAGKVSYSHRRMEVDVGSDEEGMLLRKRRKPHMEVSEGDTSGRHRASKIKQQISRDYSDNVSERNPEVSEGDTSGRRRASKIKQQKSRDYSDNVSERNPEVSEGGTSGRRRASKIKQQKSRDYSDNEMVSSPKMAAKADKDQIVSEESIKSKSGRKRARKESPRTPQRALKYDESLIGAKIRVWWPRDQQFYPGTVDSYNPISKRHKVLYFDGDEEILLLKGQRFEFIEGDEEEEKRNNLIPDAASEMSRKKAKKSDSSIKKSKTPVSSKSESSAGRVSVDGTESEAKRSDDATKSASGRRGRTSKFGNKTDGSTLTGSQSENNNGMSSVDTPKAGTTPKNELNKSTDGTPDVASKSDSISKRGRKHKDNTLITGIRSKGDASRAGSKGKDAETGSGSKSKSDTVKPGKKSKEDDTTRAVQKPKNASNSDGGSKSDGVKDQSGSSGGQEAEDAAGKVNSASRKLQESEGRSGKKRQKKSQG